MVRVLACHHFQGQQIGQCEEAVALTLAENVFIIALENKLNVYSSLKTHDLQEWFFKKRQSLEFGTGEIGKYFSYQSKTDPKKTEVKHKVNLDNNDEIGDELILCHSFAPVDTVKTISYNQRGHYLLSLEKHDVGVSNTDAHSVRAYFQWDRKTEGKPMRARVAGLVSPTGGEWEEGSLKMIEIPPTPLFATRAATSCCLTGNIACLSSDSRVNIYTFRVKEGSGRNKAQYADFDLVCTVQLYGDPGISPERISFTLDFVCCSDSNQVNVFRIIRKELFESEVSKKKPGFDIFTRVKMPPASSTNQQELVNGFHHHHDLMSNTVVFDPRDESTKIYLRTITKANRKTKHQNLTFNEEFLEDITVNKSNVTYSHQNIENGFLAEDLLRISRDGDESSGNPFIQAELYPIRVMNTVGGVTCVVGTSKEVYVYNLPRKRNSFVTRVSSHPFTSNLISFSFDSLFLHAITESGLETYTMRNLYHPLKEAEGFQVYKNDCPLQDESPVLVGIRPFLGVRYMAANKSTLCLLSSPVPADSILVTISPSEENSWTIYSLHLPSMDLLYQDIYKAAQLLQESSPESYFILLCELHLLLRSTMTSCPASEAMYRTKYLETCRLIGFEYFKKSTKDLGRESNELVDKGVTYLRMAGCDLQYIFAPENSGLTKDPALIPGIVRFIQINLPIASVDSDSRLSPTLSKTIVEFLANHSSEALIALVLDVAWLRECNSSRLVEIITPLAEAKKYRCDEALALLLSLVARYGEDSTGKSRVKQVLSKCQTHELESKFQLSWLLTKRNKQYCLSDLAICLSAADTQVHINVLSGALNSGGITLNDVVVPFVQGVNLNSDIRIQQSLSKSLCCILENYFVKKLKITGHDQLHNSATLVVSCTPEETRALHTLVRSYLTNISTNPNTQSPKSDGNKPQQKPILENGEITDLAHISLASPTIDEPTELPDDMQIEEKWQLFGKIPSFLRHIVPDLIPDGKCVTIKPSPFSSPESKENFIKLMSLLGSPLGRTDGVHQLVLTSLKQKNNMDSQLYSSLELMCESCERAIDISMAQYPTVLMLFAKETFGKSTRRWKTLVSKLKEMIKSKSNGAEAFTIIIESVYLHVANILSPTELEEVLDKEEENAKFYAACRRVDLANTFKEKVVELSTAYLDQSK